MSPSAKNEAFGTVARGVATSLRMIEDLIVELFGGSLCSTVCMRGFLQVQQTLAGYLGRSLDRS